MNNNAGIPLQELILKIIDRTSIEEDGIKRNSNGIPATGSIWYVISTNWLEKWKSLYRNSEETKGFSIGKVDNTDIISLPTHNIWTLSAETILKPGLTLGLEYEIVPPRVWKYFKLNFGIQKGSEIIRTSVNSNKNETNVEITFKPLQIFFVIRKRDFFPEIPVTFYISHYAKTSDLIRKVRDLYKEKTVNNLDIRNIRIWHIDANINYSEFKEKIKKTGNRVPGKLARDSSLEDAEIADNDLIVAEIKQTLDEWFLEMEKTNIKLCKACNTPISDNAYYQKNFEIYCSLSCLPNGNTATNNHNNNHANSNGKAVLSSRGLVGLQNLGNTCFMNSGLQCLSNTHNLTEYFLTGKYIKDINSKNPLGSGGKLVREYADLVKEIWSDSSKIISPWDFKKTFSQYKTQFSGYHQHDSQEMLSMLLDGLHEDLNKVNRKPYIEEFKTDGLSEDEISEIYWNSHLARNQSKIVDLMHGQFRSEVICPDCKNISLAFDPFLMLALPIPNKELVWVDIYFLPFDEQSEYLKLKIKTYKKSTGLEIKKIAANYLGISEDFLALATFLNTKIQMVIDSSQKINVIHFKLALYEVRNINLNIYDDILAYLESKNERLKDSKLYRPVTINNTNAKDSVNIYDCFRYFENPEQLDEVNSIYCKSCRAHVQGIKKMEVYKLPKILIVHLKRFKHNGFYNSKIDKFVEFPVEGLDLRNYCIRNPGIYDLYALSNHFGSTGSGHYTAYAKNRYNQRWYNFDDSSVSIVSNPESIVTSSAYVLFYLQREGTNN
ncbi:unnamed protein product [Blepharisma stoltei]|uniref:Ubiquitin carboxyl-terminal hydrolase n=1 Tax=Blepharisma stoltei TaxID=1481888 RepID=A0AAU9JHF0_9CILI|nr:unnamed protein product [Blepharisma stoltei]